MTQMTTEDLIRDAIFIRTVEEKLLSLFRKGAVNGTIHTCIGQEFSALAFGKQLEQTDSLFSNHRGHGHFLAFTGDSCGLIAEVMGRKSGVCGGVGGSQHLCKGTFHSNGVQGGIVAVAAGMALAHKLRGDGRIGAVFIGDGTLGEGIVYETFNLAAKWEIPLLFVCEDNGYAQSTHHSCNLAGAILDRPRAFGIETFEDSTEHYDRLMANAQKSILYVRSTGRPAFHLVHTYRLSAHSTGDDLRDHAEIVACRDKDPITAFSRQDPARYAELAAEATRKIDACIDAATDREQTVEEYSALAGNPVPSGEILWSPLVLRDNGDRFIGRLNKAFHHLMDKFDDIVFIGEDIHSPYGGAFKATLGLSARHPRRVLTTPISEAAITGLANGLAMNGYRPFLEIMFGDFMTLAMDQIINHASKFHHMYNGQKRCPVVIRTPMGGRRGFGPTHSQTLDKFLVGIDNVKVVALNTLIDPLEIYETIYREEEHPVIVIENKTDYGRRHSRPEQGITDALVFERSSSRYPVIRMSPKDTAPDVTIVTYGGMLHEVMDAVNELFDRHEILAEVIVLTQISPLPVREISDAVASRFIVVAEEGSSFGGPGSEIVATLAEKDTSSNRFLRIGSLPLPIPSARELERQVLCTRDHIVAKVAEVLLGD